MSQGDTKLLRRRSISSCNTCLTLFLLFGFGYLPAFSTLTPIGMKLLGIFLGVVYGYSTCEIIWPSLAAFIAFGLSGFSTMNETVAFMLGSPLTFQIITQYFTTGAIVVYGFGKWFVRWSLSKKIFSGRPLFYTWCFMFIFMWASIVINQISLALLLYAVWGDIADSCGYKKGSSFLYYGYGGILLSTVMGNAMIPYKSWMLGLAELWAAESGSAINFGGMFLITGVCGAVIITVYVFCGAKIFKVDLCSMAAFDVNKLGDESKRLRPRAKRIIVLYLITILLMIFAGTFPQTSISLWINKSLTTGGLYCLCAAILMVLPSGERNGQGAIHFDDIKHSDAAVSWPIIFMCAVTIPLANALMEESTGVRQWLTDIFSPMLAGRSAMFVSTFTMIVLMLFVNFGTNIAFGTAMIPIVAPFAVQLGGGANLIGVALVWITNMGFLLPGSSAPASLYHGRSELTSGRMRNKVMLFCTALILSISIVVFGAVQVFCQMGLT